MLTFLFSSPALRLSRRPRAQMREVRKGKAPPPHGGLSCHLPRITRVRSFPTLPKSSPCPTSPHSSAPVAREPSLRANPGSLLRESVWRRAKWQQPLSNEVLAVAFVTPRLEQ